MVSREELDKGDIFYNTTPSNIGQRDYTKSTEMKRRHVIEKRDNCLKRVHELEVKLHITQRWEPGSTQWKAAAAKLHFASTEGPLTSLKVWLYRGFSNSQR